MKTFTLHTVIKNFSEYTIDNIWENAQDIEHVTRLHQNTNAYFELLHVDKHDNSSFKYDTMIYRAKRKLVFLKLNSFGFRAIHSEYNLRQLEYLPVLGITTALNSLVHKNNGDNRKEFPSILVDEIILQCPWYLKPLSQYLISSLKRHTKIQCAEDEPYRERREMLLDKKGIHFPYSVFFKPTSESLWSQFTETVQPEMLEWAQKRGPAPFEKFRQPEVCD